jgi:hypothetical protein
MILSDDTISGINAIRRAKYVGTVMQVLIGHGRISRLHRATCPAAWRDEAMRAFNEAGCDADMADYALFSVAADWFDAYWERAQ